jgi:hypothetical protein
MSCEPGNEAINLKIYDFLALFDVTLIFRNYPSSIETNPAPVSHLKIMTPSLQILVLNYRATAPESAL